MARICICRVCVFFSSQANHTRISWFCSVNFSITLFVTFFDYVPYIFFLFINTTVRCRQINSLCHENDLISSYVENSTESAVRLKKKQRWFKPQTIKPTNLENSTNLKQIGDDWWLITSNVYADQTTRIRSNVDYLWIDLRKHAIRTLLPISNCNKTIVTVPSWCWMNHSSYTLGLNHAAIAQCVFLLIYFIYFASEGTFNSST